MTFSFIIPSRGNWYDVKKMLDSFERTTRKKEDIEILIVFDEGTAEDVPKLIISQCYSFVVKTYYRPHSEWWTRDYFNFLADRTVGENICAFNDDAFMRTWGWDDIIRKKIKDSGWSIYFIDIPDSARIKYGHKFPCFPMISRKGFINTGYFFHEQIKVYPPDRVLHEMYEKVERIIKADEVFITHDHIIESDPSKNHLLKIFMEQRAKGELNIDVTREVMTLLRLANRDYCKSKSKLNRILEIIKEK